MENKATLGKWLLIAGLVFVVVSIVADFIPGSPVTNPNKFGEIQIAGVLVGIITAIAGWVLIRKT